MKKVKYIFLIIITSFLFAGCVYTGIARGEKKDIFYITKSDGTMLKCKRFGKRLVCIKYEIRDIEPHQSRLYRERQRRRHRRNHREESGSDNSNNHEAERRSGNSREREYNSRNN